MELLFGIAAFVLVGLTVPIVAVLAIAFVYARVHRGQRVDINTGLSAYAVILVTVAAVVLTIGVARLLTALMGEIDYDYTYGDFGPSFPEAFDGQDFPDFQSEDQRQEEDVANGLALVATGVLVGALHLILRAYLRDRGNIDTGVEGAWDVFSAIVLGVVVLALIATVFTQTFERAIVEDRENTPGEAIAAMWAFTVLWLVYAYRALTHLGGRLLGPRPEPVPDRTTPADL